jgi:hypothetical protein
MAAAGARAMLATTSRGELWGDHQVTLVGSDNSTVVTTCEVNPVPDFMELFQNIGAFWQRMRSACAARWRTAARPAR